MSDTTAKSVVGLTAIEVGFEPLPSDRVEMICFVTVSMKVTVSLALAVTTIGSLLVTELPGAGCQ